jgi:hypothetical protein
MHFAISQIGETGVDDPQRLEPRITTIPQKQKAQVASAATRYFARLSVSR